MKTAAPERLFASREEFRAWLEEHAATSEGVWLVFGKKKSVRTLKASEALEEALCFGWIDGRMQSLDDTRYVKYFSRRRPKSVWSVKNKQIVEALREQGRMTALGEQAVEAAKASGQWDARTAESERAMVDTLRERLAAFPEAHERFLALPPSAQLAEARWFHLYKSEERREQTLKEIIGKLSRA